MRIRSRLLPVLILLGHAAVVHAADAADACHSALPDSLVAAAARQFPEYRAPLAADNLPEDVAFNVKQGHSGCLGVASADLDGDGVADYVIGLTPLQGLRPRVALALARGGQWVFHLIESEVATRARLYVDVVPPGTYERAESLGPPHAEDDRRQLTCRWSGAIVGTTRATGVVYCLERGSWWRVAVAG
jgi:hypothetical protein